MAYATCGAKKRQGEGTCRRPAGWGTDHPGLGRCKLHFGSVPHVEASYARQRELQIAEDAVVTYGLPREVDPHAALMEELHRSAGHVSWLAGLVAEMDEAAELKQRTLGTDGRMWERPAVWVDLYDRERKHLAAVAKTCIDAGIAERQVRLAEQQGSLIAQVLRGVLEELGVADRPEVPAVVRRHLTLVEQPAA